jgi:hypothetical protein
MPRYANDIAIFAVQHQTLDSSCVEESNGSTGSITKEPTKPSRDGGLDSSMHRRPPAPKFSRPLEELAE